MLCLEEEEAAVVDSALLVYRSIVERRRKRTSHGGLMAGYQGDNLKTLIYDAFLIKLCSWKEKKAFKRNNHYISVITL